jgi:hypothetical protein
LSPHHLASLILHALKILDSLELDLIVLDVAFALVRPSSNHIFLAFFFVVYLIGTLRVFIELKRRLIFYFLAHSRDPLFATNFSGFTA